MKKILVFLFVFSFLFGQDKIIKDMRGVDVKIPQPLNNVLTIDDGFIEGVMTHLGVINKVKAIGSWSMKRDYKYNFSTIKGEKYTLKGWNTMKYLHPWLNDIPCVNSPQGNILDFEKIAKSKPELIIIRIGDCTLRGSNKEKVEKTIKTIEDLGLNLAVIYSPTYFNKSDLSTMKDEMAVLGDIFGQKEKALKLYSFLNETQELVKSRTKDIKENEKTTVLMLGLSPKVRKNGGAGTVWGINTPESYIIEKISNAKNAFTKNGHGIVLSYEQIYAINPDVIILPTSWGYHPPRELYESPDFKILNELKAIKNKRVYSMPWSPMNCARRVEFPLDILIIAKAAYPDRFKDIKVHEFALKLYKKVYGVNDITAKELRSQQILDWAIRNDF